MAGKKATSGRTKSPDATRAVGVVLEQIQSQMSVVAEAVTSMQAKLDKKPDADEVFRRFELLEEVVRQNSADIRQNSADIRQNSAELRALEARLTRVEEAVAKNSQDILQLREEVGQLREEVARLRRDFDHRTELTRIADLEGRVAAIERRLAEH
jgi:chromosome segregation ATPase